MAIEYVVMYPCKAKEELPDGELLELVKAKGQAEALIEHIRSKGDTTPVSELTVTRMVYRPDGLAEEQEISIQEQLDKATVLADYAAGCNGCPACLGSEAFACYRAINYPILSATESWLLSRLPQDAKGPAGSMLRRIIETLKCDGAAFGRLRADGTFFQTTRAKARTWGGLFSKWQLTADQVLELLFASESLQPAHCGMLAFVLGVLPHTTDPAVLKDEAARQEALVRARAEFPRDGGQIEAMGWYLEGLRVCAVLDAPMAISF